MRRGGVLIRPVIRLNEPIYLILTWVHRYCKAYEVADQRGEPFHLDAFVI